MPNKDIRKASARQINELLAICIAGEDGYLAAVDHVTDCELSLILRRLGRQRRNFAIELGRAIISLDCVPTEPEDLCDLPHRAWVNLKPALITKDDQTILAECARWEHAALNAYAGVINQPPHAAPHDELIKAQAGVVRADYELIRTRCNEPVHAG
jgi:uncharacterized protein (TIGR02284 family)